VYTYTDGVSNACKNKRKKRDRVNEKTDRDGFCAVSVVKPGGYDKMEIYSIKNNFKQEQSVIKAANTEVRNIE